MDLADYSLDSLVCFGLGGIFPLPVWVSSHPYPLLSVSSVGAERSGQNRNQGWGLSGGLGEHLGFLRRLVEVTASEVGLRP